MKNLNLTKLQDSIMYAVDSVFSKRMAVGIGEAAVYAEDQVNLSDGSKALNMVFFDTKKKRFHQLVMLNDNSRSVVKDPVFESADIEYWAFAMCLIQYFMMQEEEDQKNNAVSYEFTRLLEALKNSDTIEVKDTILLLDAFSSRITHHQIVLTDSIIKTQLRSIDSGKACPTKVIFGEFNGFKPKREKIEPEKVGSDELLTKFKITNRDFSEEEQKMMFTIPDYYSPSENVISIATKIKKSWSRPEHLHKTNVLMEGPAGTGKTMDAKVLSRLLGLPYTKITCFSDMDSSDVVGSILPVADEEQEKRVFPDEDEVMLDPVGCYKDLTGILDESITEEAVLDELHKQLQEYYSSEAGQSTPEYRYYASEIVKAFEHGYLLEIQEPTCIADAAVLLILNSALEKDWVINLPQRTVRRHPEFICVMTTNRNYNGCRPLNQALRDRFNITKSVSLPDEDEIKERLKSSTGCENESLLYRTAKFLTSLNCFLEDAGINAGVSMRGAIDFIADVDDGFDIEESLKEDMIYKITTDSEEIEEIWSFVETSTEILNL